MISERIHSNESPGLVEHREILDQVQAFIAMSAIRCPSLSWHPSESLGLTGRGGVFQLQGPSLELDPLRALLAERAQKIALTSGFQLCASCDVQAFFVRMVGDGAVPALQLPHVDRSESYAAPPVCTCVYYLEIANCEGGELALFERGSDAMTPKQIAVPCQNSMIVFPGDQLHAVLPLRQGNRVSVVINFYKAPSTPEESFDR